MIDFRYHALSLVAVLVALAVGLLVGVAIGDSGLVSSAERDLRRGLRADVTRARDELARTREDLAERRQIEADLYPKIVQDRLLGQDVGVIAFGELDDSDVELVQQALSGTGADLASVIAFRQPLDTEQLAEVAAGTSFEDIADDPEVAGALGERVGEDLAEGGSSFLARGRVQGALLGDGSSSGSLETGLEAVVLIREPPELDGEEAELAEAFEDGVVDALVDEDVDVVGAETGATDPSQIRWFSDDQRISSVDHLDKLEGRVSLVFALAGERGTFGTKPTADALLPRGD